jgi:hypothetical protein
MSVYGKIDHDAVPLEAVLQTRHRADDVPRLLLLALNSSAAAYGFKRLETLLPVLLLACRNDIASRFP